MSHHTVIKMRIALALSLVLLRFGRECAAGPVSSCSYGPYLYVGPSGKYTDCSFCANFYSYESNLCTLNKCADTMLENLAQVTSWAATNSTCYAATCSSGYELESSPSTSSSGRRLTQAIALEPIAPVCMPVQVHSVFPVISCSYGTYTYTGDANVPVPITYQDCSFCADFFQYQCRTSQSCEANSFENLGFVSSWVADNSTCFAATCSLGYGLESSTSDMGGSSGRRLAQVQIHAPGALTPLCMPTQQIVIPLSPSPVHAPTAPGAPMAPPSALAVTVKSLGGIAWTPFAADAVAAYVSVVTQVPKIFLSVEKTDAEALSVEVVPSWANYMPRSLSSDGVAGAMAAVPTGGAAATVDALLATTDAPYSIALQPGLFEALSRLVTPHVPASFFRVLGVSSTSEKKGYSNRITIGVVLQPGVATTSDSTSSTTTSSASGVTTSSSDGPANFTASAGRRMLQLQGTEMSAPASDWVASFKSMFDRTNCVLSFKDQITCHAFASAQTLLNQHVALYTETSPVRLSHSYDEQFSFLTPYECADGSIAWPYSPSASRRALLACSNALYAGGCLQTLLADAGGQESSEVLFELKFANAWQSYASETNVVAFAVCEVALCDYQHDVQVTFVQGDSLDAVYSAVFYGPRATFAYNNFFTALLSPVTNSANTDFKGFLTATNKAALPVTVTNASLYEPTGTVYWCGSTSTFNGWSLQNEVSTYDLLDGSSSDQAMCSPRVFIDNETSMAGWSGSSVSQVTSYSDRPPLANITGAAGPLLVYRPDSMAATSASYTPGTSSDQWVATRASKFMLVGTTSVATKIFTLYGEGLNSSSLPNGKLNGVVNSVIFRYAVVCPHNQEGAMEISLVANQGSPDTCNYYVDDASPTFTFNCSNDHDQANIMQWRDLEIVIPFHTSDVECTVTVSTFGHAVALVQPVVATTWQQCQAPPPPYGFACTVTSSNLSFLGVAGSVDAALPYKIQIYLMQQMCGPDACSIDGVQFTPTVTYGVNFTATVTATFDVSFSSQVQFLFDIMTSDTFATAVGALVGARVNRSSFIPNPPSCSAPPAGSYAYPPPAPLPPPVASTNTVDMLTTSFFLTTTIDPQSSGWFNTVLGPGSSGVAIQKAFCEIILCTPSNRLDSTLSFMGGGRTGNFLFESTDTWTDTEAKAAWPNGLIFITGTFVSAYNETSNMHYRECLLYSHFVDPSTLQPRTPPCTPQMGVLSPLQKPSDGFIADDVFLKTLFFANGFPSDIFYDNKCAVYWGKGTPYVPP